MNFLDKTTIELIAGNGGDGIISWRREAHHANGGPWGGDGGNGGNIVIIGDHNEDDLFKLKNIKEIKAQDGQKGGTKLCHGANGEDYTIRVPLGTIIYDYHTGDIICDIIESNQEYIICYGGKGGHGNAHFKSSYNKAPNLFEKGEKGQRKKVILEMKYIADVGIIGYPNAGKSTLINTISNTKAKTANYQFTTLNPILGTIKDENNKSIVFADIPGLIEGASEGIGLGFDFLKHIERCHILIHLISCNDDDNVNIIDAYNNINSELKKYDESILNKKIFIALSKSEFDIDNSKYVELKNYLKDQKIYRISSFENKLDNLINDVIQEYHILLEQKEKLANDSSNVYKVIKEEKQQEDIIEYIKLDDNKWKVTSNKIEYWINRIPLTTDENVVRFNQKIELDKIQDELIKKGAQIGDTLLIGEDIEYEIN